MLKNRIIAVIIVRDGQVVQSEKFRHVNVIHYDAYHAIESFNRWSIDEIVLLNVSRDKNSQGQFLDILQHVSKTCFVPLSVGGFIDSVEYGAKLISGGADKLVINTMWHDNLAVVKQLVDKFGKQCLVASIDIKMHHFEKKVFIDRGTRCIDTPFLEWVKFLENNGAGEILFNNIDHDGNRGGYDLDGLFQITSNVDIPVIAFGGVLSWNHMLEGFCAGANAVAAANIFHYKEMATKQAKRYLSRKNINVRLES